MLRTKFTKIIAAAIALALCYAVPAFAQSVIADFSGSVQAIIGAYPGMVQGSSIVRTATATAYSANQSICAATSVTVCVPGTISIAGQQGGSGINGGRLTAKRVTLLKSGATTSGANFTLWFYSAAPVLSTPLQFDYTSYTGPRSADMPNYLGNAICTNGTATSDTSAGVWFECSVNGAGSSLVLQAVAGTRTLYYVLSANTAYTPATSETFTPFMGGVY